MAIERERLSTEPAEHVGADAARAPSPIIDSEGIGNRTHQQPPRVREHPLTGPGAWAAIFVIAILFVLAADCLWPFPR